MLGSYSTPPKVIIVFTSIILQCLSKEHKEFVCDYVMLLLMQIAICAMCSKGVHVYSWNAS